MSGHLTGQYQGLYLVRQGNPRFVSNYDVLVEPLSLLPMRGVHVTIFCREQLLAARICLLQDWPHFLRRHVAQVVEGSKNFLVTRPLKVEAAYAWVQVPPFWLILDPRVDDDYGLLYAFDCLVNLLLYSTLSSDLGRQRHLVRFVDCSLFGDAGNLSFLNLVSPSSRMILWSYLSLLYD